MGSPAPALKAPRRRSFKLEDYGFHLVILIICAFTVFPFVWMLSTSIKAPDEVFTNDFQLIPAIPRWANFPDAFTYFPVDKWIWNSFGIAVLTTVGKLLMSVPAAFAFARLRFRGDKLLFSIVLATVFCSSRSSDV